jgi:hypothetical protein
MITAIEQHCQEECSTLVREILQLFGGLEHPMGMVEGAGR